MKDIFKKSIFITAIIVVLLLIGFNTYRLLNGINEYKKGNSTYDDIKLQVVNNSVEPGKTDVDRVDFNRLKAINPDVVGWLSMKDTVIDYPVVKGNDNEYYLNHLYTGEWNSLGTLFVDFRNYDLFTDRNTVIYGHSMLNGSMFFILEKYEKQSFYEEHKEFLFETPDKKYKLLPFAGKIMDGKEAFVEFDFDSDDDFYNYIDYFIRNSTFRSDVEFTAQDKVVMMIKCSDDFEDARYVLLCKVEEL